VWHRPGPQLARFWLAGVEAPSAVSSNASLQIANMLVGATGFELEALWRRFEPAAEILSEAEGALGKWQSMKDGRGDRI
jgi:hypothetical protein